MSTERPRSAYQAVDAAADRTGDQAQQDAERSRKQHAEHADGQRNAQAVENGGQHVAALLVGTEQERAGHRGSTAARSVNSSVEAVPGRMDSAPPARGRRSR